MDLKMNEAFILDAPHIDQIGESMEEFLSIFKTERKIALKVKLAMEDLLFIVLKNSNSPRNCRLLFPSLMRSAMKRARALFRKKSGSLCLTWTARCTGSCSLPISMNAFCCIGCCMTKAIRHSRRTEPGRSRRNMHCCAVSRNPILPVLPHKWRRNELK